MKAQLTDAVALDRQTNKASVGITNSFMQRGITPSDETIVGYVEAVRDYVAAAPAWLEHLWEVANAHGQATQVDWFLREVEGYCQTANDVVPDWHGLLGVLDDAYVVRRMVRGLYDRLGVTSDPVQDQIDQTMRDVVLGPEVGAYLDRVVAATLGGPAAQQAFMVELQRQALEAYQATLRQSAAGDEALSAQMNAR